jgi:hypothetical protein
MESKDQRVKSRIMKQSSEDETKEAQDEPSEWILLDNLKKPSCHGGPRWPQLSRARTPAYQATDSGCPVHFGSSTPRPESMNLTTFFDLRDQSSTLLKG